MGNLTSIICYVSIYTEVPLYSSDNDEDHGDNRNNDTLDLFERIDELIQDPNDGIDWTNDEAKQMAKVKDTAKAKEMAKAKEDDKTQDDMMAKAEEDDKTQDKMAKAEEMDKAKACVLQPASQRLTKEKPKVPPLLNTNNSPSFFNSAAWLASRAACFASPRNLMDTVADVVTPKAPLLATRQSTRNNKGQITRLNV